MLVTTSKARPTKQDAYQAMDLLSVYFQTHQPIESPGLKAARKKAQQHNALALQCDQTAEALESRLRALLPKEHHELLTLYSIMTVAHYAPVNDESEQFFRQSNAKAQRLLK